MQMMTRRRLAKEGGTSNAANADIGSPDGKTRSSTPSRSSNLRAALLGMVLTFLIILVMAKVVPSHVEKFLGITRVRTHGQMVRRAPKRKTKMACVDKAQKA